MLGFAADHLRVEWFPAGSFIIEQGEPATELFCILSGSAAIVVESEDGGMHHRGDDGVPAASSARTGSHPVDRATPT